MIWIIIIIVVITIFIWIQIQKDKDFRNKLLAEKRAKALLLQGKTKNQIRIMLINEGWREDIADAALSEVAPY